MPQVAGRFVEHTIPAGATAIVYQIQAVRSTKVGEAVMFNVNFGSNGRTLPPAWMAGRGKTMIAA